MTRFALDPSWMAGAVPGAVVCVRGSVEIEVAFDAGDDVVEAVVAALAGGCDAGELAGAAQASPAEAAELLELLAEQGALVPGGSPAIAPESGLAAAIRGVLEGTPVERAWTADELLVLPPEADAETARGAVRAFVAGLRPSARLAAYAQVAASGGGGAIAGDVPDPDAAARALEVVRGLDRFAIHVVALDGGTVVSVTPAELAARCFDVPHRLGPLVAVDGTAPGPGGRATAAAIHAPASLRHARSERDRHAHGSGDDPAEAALIARAEAAERFAMGDPASLRIRRARPGAFFEPALPGTLHRWSARQLRDHPERRADADAAERLWIPARTVGGTERWVPVEAVLVPFDDPLCGRTMEQTSSGVAAHTSASAAADNAVLELVERDAFLWTWVQRVSRERIDPASLPAVASLAYERLRGTDCEVDLVNLTLDTCPVVLVVVRDAERLLVTAAASPDPARAAQRALSEAAMLAASLGDGGPEPVDAVAVRTPDDHLARHRDPQARAGAAFLTGGADLIDVREVASAPGAPLEAVRVVAEPLLVDLTTSATHPFHVARALVPGLVPMSFGWDGEPLGMPRLAAPLTLADGRTAGAQLDLEDAGPVPPHPFA